MSNHAIELLPEVPQTLLSFARHRLILVTKGAFEEQSGKVERSGLKKYFAAVEIVAEKNPDAYHTLVEKHELTPDSTWMVGNSPKSDINPALAAGLHAVFVPHGDTWILEHEEVNPAPPQQKLLIVGRFAELREHSDSRFGVLSLCFVILSLTTVYAVKRILARPLRRRVRGFQSAISLS